MYTLLDNNYKITKGKENFAYEEVKSLFTDYFQDYDYVLGDYSYGKIRLKGFYDSDNKKVRKINDIKYLESYIKDYCSPGAKTFLLKKEKNPKNSKNMVTIQTMKKIKCKK